MVDYMDRFVIKNLKHCFLSCFFILACTSFCGLTLNSCKDDFTSDASYRLTYSVDTLRFDTIFSEVLTPTQTIKIYNHSGKDIQIESCQLRNEYDCFQINLNGRSGTNFSRINIEDGDSLFLFVQSYIPEGGKETPLYVDGIISFSYNGNNDQVVLSAFGQDVHKIRNKSISADTVWTNDKPYLIYGTLTVDSATTLTIQEGARLYFHNDATMLVDGTLVCNGSLSAPITFRGDRTDNITPSTSYDQLSNQWGGIELSGSSTGNVINHTLIKNGNFGIQVDSADVDAETIRLVIANSQIHNVDQSGLKTHCATVYAYNSLFTCAGNGCVVLQGGKYIFNHCTIANYTRGASLYAYGVVLANSQLYDDKIESLQSAFNNCIVYGSSVNELYFKYEELDETFKIAFRHCLLRCKTLPEELANDLYFTSPIWNEWPDFSKVNVNERLYDFHIDSLSPCKYKGLPAVLTQYPECQLDKDEKTRVSDSLPDIGAFQWQPSVIATESTEEN